MKNRWYVVVKVKSGKIQKGRFFVAGRLNYREKGYYDYIYYYDVRTEIRPRCGVSSGAFERSTEEKKDEKAALKYHMFGNLSRKQQRTGDRILK